MGDATVKMVPESRIIGDGTSAGPAADCKVAEYLVDALADVGVRYIFGVVGGTVFPLFTATVGRQAQIVMTKHEAGAAFMADGYARASGGLGACVATSGPGATNLITGIAAAYADSIPVVVLTGQVATKSFGRGALQESSTEGVDIVDVFKQVTRYSILTFRADRIPAIWHKALRMATGGRPGPVHLSLPADVQEQTIQRPVQDESDRASDARLRPGCDQAGGAVSAPSAAADDPGRARRHPVERVGRDSRHRRDAGDTRSRPPRRGRACSRRTIDSRWGPSGTRGHRWRSGISWKAGWTFCSPWGRVSASGARWGGIVASSRARPCSTSTSTPTRSARTTRSPCP